MKILSFGILNPGDRPEYMIRCPIEGEGSGCNTNCYSCSCENPYVYGPGFPCKNNG